MLGSDENPALATGIQITQNTLINAWVCSTYCFVFHRFIGFLCASIKADKYQRNNYFNSN